MTPLPKFNRVSVMSGLQKGLIRIQAGLHDRQTGPCIAIVRKAARGGNA